jgi:ATP-dependent Zn protease
LALQTIGIFWNSTLLRPGRFDRQLVNLPDRLEPCKYFKSSAKNKPLGEDVSLVQLANRTQDSPVQVSKFIK